MFARFCISVLLLYLSGLRTCGGSVIGPAFTHEPADSIVHPRVNASFFCSATGMPIPAYKWLFNGHEMRVKSTAVLIIPETTRQDVGIYQCVAENDAGKIVSRKAKLNIYELSIEVHPVNTSFYFNKVTNTIGNGTAVFNCTAGHLDKLINIHWERVVSRTSFTINSTTTPRYVQFRTHEIGTLQIFQPEHADFKGGYRCVVTHPKISGKRVSKTAMLIPTDEAKYQDFVFTMSPQTAYVDENDPAVLGCATSGLQDITLHWTLRNQGVNRIIASNSGVVSDLASVIALIKPANLHIKKMINDKLQFGCMVQVPPKFLSAEAEVILIKTPSIDGSLPQYFTRIEGETNELRLGCVTNGTPNPSITWLFNGDPIANSSVLSISSFHERDRGMYQCFVENDYGSNHSSTFLDVHYGAKISKGPEDKVVLIGGTVYFNCLARANPDNIVYNWAKNGQRLMNSTRIILFANGTMSIHNATLQDTATYSCIPSNALTTMTEASASLIVAIFPTIIFSLSNLTVNASANASLPCLADGVPKPTIHWTTVLSRQTYQNENNTLFIRSVNANDDGPYTCTATNPIGSTHATTQLIVQVAPTTPEDSDLYVRVGGDIEITCVIVSNPKPAVSWSFGDQLLTDLIHLNKMSTKNKYNSSLIIKSITDGEIGDYQCTASNLLGTSSTTFHLIKQFVPDIPKGATVEFLSQSEITVQWQFPWNGGAPIKHFLIRYRSTEAEDKPWVQETTNELSYTITDLQPQTFYEIQVSAINAIGTGEPAVLNATTQPLVTRTPTVVTSSTMAVSDPVKEAVSDGSATTGIIVGVLIAVLAVIAVIVICLVVVLRRKQGQYCVNENVVPEAPFESPEKPQLAEMAGSPKKVVSDPLIPEAKIETEPKDTQVPEPLLQTALKEEKEMTSESQRTETVDPTAES